MSAEWSAIVVAGSRPGGDPLAAAHGHVYKGQIDLLGEPMLARVVRTLLAVPAIGRILILAQEPDLLLAGELAWLRDEPRVAADASGAGIASSVAALAGGEPAPWPVLVTTADHPLLTPPIVEEFLSGAGGADLAVGLVERRTILGRYPGNKRTWLPLKGGAYTGANLFALTGPKARPALDLWSGIEQERKKARRLFRHFGPALFLRAVTRTITIEAALERAGRRLGLSARPVILSDPEAGIDVDKPDDLLMAERILRSRLA